MICEGANLGTGLSTIMENDESRDPADWLHRNDSYVPVRRGPHTYLSGTLHAPNEPG